MGTCFKNCSKDLKEKLESLLDGIEMTTLTEIKNIFQDADNQRQDINDKLESFKDSELPKILYGRVKETYLDDDINGDVIDNIVCKTINNINPMFSILLNNDIEYIKNKITKNKIDMLVFRDIHIKIVKYLQSVYPIETCNSGLNCTMAKAMIIVTSAEGDPLDILFPKINGIKASIVLNLELIDSNASNMILQLSKKLESKLKVLRKENLGQLKLQAATSMVRSTEDLVKNIVQGLVSACVVIVNEQSDIDKDVVINKLTEAGMYLLGNICYTRNCGSSDIPTCQEAFDVLYDHGSGKNTLLGSDALSDVSKLSANNFHIISSENVSGLTDTDDSDDDDSDDDYDDDDDDDNDYDDTDSSDDDSSDDQGDNDSNDSEGTLSIVEIDSNCDSSKDNGADPEKGESSESEGKQESPEESGELSEAPAPPEESSEATEEVSEVPEPSGKPCETPRSSDEPSGVSELSETPGPSHGKSPLGKRAHGKETDGPPSKKPDMHVCSMICYEQGKLYISDIIPDKGPDDVRNFIHQRIKEHVCSMSCLSKARDIEDDPNKPEDIDSLKCYIHSKVE